jgi:hypothetical protein
MLLVRLPTSYAAERAYVLDVVLGDFLGLPWQASAEVRSDIEVTLPERPGSGKLTIVDCLFATPESQWLTPASMPRRPLARWELDGTAFRPKLVASSLPVLYGRRLERGDYYEEGDKQITLGLDVFGAIFFQLARYEEIACSTRDAHGRFPAEAMLAYGEGFLERPLVNEYVEVLWTAMTRLWPRLQRRRRVFTESLSHDVDSPFYPPTSPHRVLRSALGDIARRHDRELAWTRLRTLRRDHAGDRGKDPYDTFELIMDLSERRGLRSAFYFIAGTTDPARDGTYALDDHRVGLLLRRIDERGHEIGLHPSYESFRSPAIVREEHDTLLRTCARLGVEQPAAFGGRQHFLRWENPITWRAWEQAGLSYDSSLGFAEHTGFRCGVCFDYRVFDLVARQPLALRERPLVVMEKALFYDRARSDREGLATVALLRDRCRLFDGNFTLLWHNSRLASRRERDLYADAILAR